MLLCYLLILYPKSHSPIHSFNPQGLVQKLSGLKLLSKTSAY
jgi:hypothetical protein